MAEAQVLVERLLAAQNPDGGWSYHSWSNHKGMSWAEPTAFVLLALQPERSSLSKALDRGLAWLASQQHTSGGWAPNATVDECTSVTSVATMALLPYRTKGIEQALNWTAAQIYQDGFSLSLFISKTLNLPPAHAPGSVPWYPGTAGWVMPTALTILALEKAARVMNRPSLHSRAAQSSAYLLSRRCVDNGWNHGGSKTRSEDATSYPETTGLALLALRSASIAQPIESLSLAKQFSTKPQSVEGLAWIQLALQSAENPVPDPEAMPSPRTTRDAALRLLALRAQSGQNPFLSP